MTAPANGSRELQDWHRPVGVSEEEDFRSKIAEGTLANSHWVFSDALSPDVLGQSLTESCRQRHFKDAQLILEEKGDDIDFSYLGIAFIVLAERQSSLATIEKLEKCKPFQLEPFLFIAFNGAVHSNNEEIVRHLTEKYAFPLTAERNRIIEGLRVAVQQGYTNLISILGAYVDPEKNEKELEEIYSEASQDALENLAKIKTLKHVSRKLLGQLFIQMVDRPLGVINRFLSTDLGKLISQEDLAKAAAAIENFHKFKGLVSHHRYDAVCQTGLISSKLSQQKAKSFLSLISTLQQKEGDLKKRILRILCIALLSDNDFPFYRNDFADMDRESWYIGFVQMILLGQSQNVLFFLDNEPAIFRQLNPSEKESLFVLASDMAHHPMNLAVMKKMVWFEDLQFALPHQAIEKCIVLTGEFALCEVLRVLVKMPQFSGVSSKAIKESFMAAGIRGDLDTVAEFLGSSREADITSKEVYFVLSCFFEKPIKEMERVALFLLKKDRLTPEQKKEINAQLETLFSPLFELGKTVQTEVEAKLAAEQFPEKYKIMQRIDFCSGIVNSSDFLELFKKDEQGTPDPRLGAILNAAAGMGFYVIASQVYQQRKEEIPREQLFFAVLQSCSSQEFFVFYEDAKVAIKLPRPQPKEQILHYLLGQWTFQNFQGPNFNQTVYPILKKGLLIAVEAGNSNGVTLLLNHMKGGSGFSLADLQEAHLLAKKHKHPQIAQKLAPPKKGLLSRFSF